MMVMGISFLFRWTGFQAEGKGTSNVSEIFYLLRYALSPSAGYPDLCGQRQNTTGLPVDE
jgi:hypothetical protein